MLFLAHSMIFELVSSLGILAKLASLEQEILSLCGSIFFISSWWIPRSGSAKSWSVYVKLSRNNDKMSLKWVKFCISKCKCSNLSTSFLAFLHFNCFSRIVDYHVIVLICASLIDDSEQFGKCYKFAHNLLLGSLYHYLISMTLTDVNRISYFMACFDLSSAFSGAKICDF